jgi:large subunit ribosomal protein L15
MKLSNIKAAEGSVKTHKRKGRGQGSGKGGTSTRGHKGAKARANYKRKIGFEGGQMPIQRRLPKFGFKNINRVEYKGVNLDTLQTLIEAGVDTITPAILFEKGLIGKKDNIKVLGRGELKGKVKISAHAFSATAKAAIESKGGEATVI